MEGMKFVLDSSQVFIFYTASNLSEFLYFWVAFLI